MINKLIFKNAWIYVLAILPLLSLAMVSISIVIFILLSLFHFIVTKNFKISKDDWKLFIIFSTPFILYLISLFWTDNIDLGFKIIQKSLSFLLLPLAFFILKPFTTANQIISFFKIYILSSGLLSVLSIVYILIKLPSIIIANSNYHTSINIRDSINHVPIIGEHPIYFSLILAVALLLLYYNRFKSSVLNFLICLFIILGILIASSMGVILAVSVVFTLVLFQDIKSTKITFTMLFLFFSGVAFTLYFSPMRARITETIENKYFYPEGNHYNSFNLRTAIYNCSFSMVDEAGLFGYAPADVQVELNSCYQKFNTKAFNQMNYNTHNQYLDYLLSFGFLGLFIILLVFGYYLKFAYSSKHFLYFNFLILFYITFLIENILARNTGIVLFTTFNCLLVYSIVLKNKILKY